MGARLEGKNAVALFADVTGYDEAARLIRTCVDRFSRIDILVNCAAAVGPGLIYDMSEAEWDAQIARHLKSSFSTCRHAAPLMKAQGNRRIINSASDAAHYFALGSAAYSAAKGRGINLSRYIARELGHDGVRCNAVCPEAATRLTANDYTLNYIRECYKAGCLSNAQLHFRLNLRRPEFAAPFYVYLVTDAAANINGRVFRVGNGQVALLADPSDLKCIHKGEAVGPWAQEELSRIVPRSLSSDLPPVPPYAKRECAPFSTVRMQSGSTWISVLPRCRDGRPPLFGNREGPNAAQRFQRLPACVQCLGPPAWFVSGQEERDIVG
jgi:NAD(P)-dependent dehydrogenase (short-subunit alcohol dehydrogenase family)